MNTQQFKIQVYAVCTAILISCTHLLVILSLFDRLTFLDCVFTLAIPAFVFLIKLEIRNLWIITLYVIFLSGYLIKAFYMYGIVGNYERLFNIALDWIVLSKADVQQAHYMSLQGILVVLLVAVVLSRFPIREPAAIPPVVKSSEYMPLVIGMFILAVALSVAQIVLGINIMGVGSDQLPGPISAFLNRLKIDWIPSLLVFFYWLSLDNRRDRRIILLFLIFLGLIDGMARASRASAIPYIIPIFYLWIITHRFKLKKALFFSATITLVALAFPYISTYRSLLLHNYDTRTAISEIMTDPMKPLEAQPLYDPFLRIGTRIVGLDSVAMILDKRPNLPEYSFNLMKLYDYRAVEYFTKDIVGVKQKNDFRSPGWFGSFILAFGKNGYLFALVLSVIAIFLVAYLLSLNESSAVMLSIYFSELLFSLSENPFGLRDWVSILIVMMMINFMTKFYLKRGAVYFKDQKKSRNYLENDFR